MTIDENEEIYVDFTSIFSKLAHLSHKPQFRTTKMDRYSIVPQVPILLCMINHCDEHADFSILLHVVC